MYCGGHWQEHGTPCAPAFSTTWEHVGESLRQDASVDQAWSVTVTDA